ncbi:hypothetical protein DFH28DRAFT_1128904 [Melampsora americana]|nr:hypothetical protein DFH28DRAFT_1128904 [Melampsora americana]
MNNEHLIIQDVQFETLILEHSTVIFCSVNWSPTTPIRASRGNIHTPTSKVSSTLVTQSLALSSAGSSVGSSISSSITTPTSTPSSSAKVQLFAGSSLITPRWPITRHKKQINKLHTIHEALLSPIGIPSADSGTVYGGKSYDEILASLGLLDDFYGKV